MAASTFINAKEVGEVLEVSPSKAYSVIHELNDELLKKGYMVVPGRVSRQYFNERFYGFNADREEENDAGI